MSPRDARRCALAGLVSLLLAAGPTGCTRGGDASSSDSPATTPSDAASSSPAPSRSLEPSTRVLPRPRVGDCRVLDFADTNGVLTDAGAKPVACKDDHTAQTFAAGPLTDATALDPQTDPEGVAEALSRDCRAALVDWLGADEAAYERSMFAYVVAVPSTSQAAAGAAWYRCDTFAAKRDGELAALPPTTQRALRGDGAPRWATCVDGGLNAEPDQVLCTLRHDWRAISAHRLGDRADPFPGDRQVTGEARTRCETDVTAWVDDPLVAFDYGWLRPASVDWQQGQRFLLCFARTPT